MKISTSPWRGMVAPLFLLGLLAGADVARASLIAYDEGYYTTGNINGQATPTSGTYGYAGTWTGAASNTIAAVSQPTLGGITGITNGGDAISFVTSSTTAQSRSEFHGFTGSSGQSNLWSSNLLRLGGTPNNGGSALFGYLSGTLATTSSTTATGAAWNGSNGASLQGFQVGIDSNFSGNGDLVVKYQSDAAGAGAVTEVDTGYALVSNPGGVTTTAYWVVTQLQVNSATSDTLNVWVLTSTPASQAALGTPTYTTTADILSDTGNLDTLALTEGATVNTADPVYIDALHLGTTFADTLAAVPEPSPLALLLLAGGLGAAIRLGTRCRAKCPA